MSRSNAKPKGAWNEDHSRRLANRIRGYLDKRRLPYVMEREDGAIVLQLKGRVFNTACG